MKTVGSQQVVHVISAVLIEIIIAYCRLDLNSLNLKQILVRWVDLSLVTMAMYLHSSSIVFYFRESNHSTSTTSTKPTKTSSKKEKRTKVLDCGKAVNSTIYDNLRGIANRKNHPHIPEPEVAMIFRKKGNRNTEVDMNELEKRLRKAKKEVVCLAHDHVQLFYCMQQFNTLQCV